MRAGLLTKRIQVFKSGLSKGRTGAQRTSWENLFGEGKYLHARIIYGKQGMKAVNGNFVLTSDITFDIRYHSQITEYNRIYWEGRWYGINAIRRYPERGEMQLDGQLIDE